MKSSPLTSPLAARLRPHASRLGQSLLLVLAFGAAEGLTALLHLPLAPGVVGLLAVLGLLLTGIVKVEWIKGGANWMLNELVLFFIPSVVAVVKYFDLFRRVGVQLVLAIALGTLLVMAATALAVHAGRHLEDRLARRGQRQADAKTA
ncbi:CidA/LrgA family protein [Achromobacter aloeverae]|uniref:CidA/LrgA family protein n=1 Tax=Achromobacter aloeverae TaxID=1750518 RepID=A0A4Q1HFN1_9BURK|nr:CidA/LrgA family protein [Achromobacter aloeverae]RXN85450.1 CidA/LrgA family protein [Achromobacter aloeverae]